ncbi:FCD domain-containing protein [Kineococcus aurantiacus]|uniref:DNA-binding GntR family transcriptional regulator n=1 Tax=Kineococcus aurantiacus TaxID=37633 RepID=A0A7Y9DQE6_9ACTN|nr:DNA-binding GntR family transcriptional regulator [Kineococcus aurantiacus]
MATPERAGVVSRRIADRIRELILDGHLQPGQRIVQDELAAEFGTSRLPVREALRMLESTGLVRLRSSSGAWVTSMDPGDLDIAYKIRERIEPLALAESVPHLTDADVARLEELQEQIERNQDVEVFLALDRELHWLTYSRTTSTELTLLAERYWDTTQSYRRAFARLAGEERRWVINAEHRLLIDAVRRRDADSAEHVLAGHIKRTRIELQRHPDLFTG